MLTTAEISAILLREVENATAELDDSRLELVFTTAFQNNPDVTEILNGAIMRRNVAREALQEAVKRFSLYTVYGIIPHDLKARWKREPVSSVR
jgi:hypothetical protein